MPLVRITFRSGRDPEALRRAGQAVHQALVEVAGAPRDDLFQILEAVPPEALNVTPSYLGITHTNDVAIVEVTLNAGRSLEVKRALYARIADGVVAATGIRREDVIVSLVEVAKENWSFGGGTMSYAPPPEQSS